MTFIFQEDGSNFRIVFSIATFLARNCQVELLQTHLDLQKKPVDSVDANSSKEASAKELEEKGFFFFKKKQGMRNFKLERCLIHTNPPENLTNIRLSTEN